MRRSRKQIEKLQTRQRERETAPPPPPPWNRLVGFAALLVVAGILAYAVELDVALGFGAGEVTGRMRWLNQEKPPPRYRELRWPVLVVENDQGQPLRYFHSFMPGLYRRIADALREYAEAHPASPFPTSLPESPSGSSSIASRRPLHPDRLSGRVRYAGLLRKTVYSFEPLSSDP